jgi:predicted O-methyltransferase YrrM
VDLGGAVTLAEQYERLCATPSDIYLHLPRFVAMVEETGAKRVLELGTRTGVSTVAWLYALEQTGGTLISVDIDERPAIGDHEHWTFVRGDDMDPDIVKQVSHPASDIVFIDTSHHWRHTCQELALYRWIVKPGGLIVCHDTELGYPEGAPAGDPVFPVKQFISG